MTYDALLSRVRRGRCSTAATRSPLSRRSPARSSVPGAEPVQPRDRLGLVGRNEHGGCRSGLLGADAIGDLLRARVSRLRCWWGFTGVVRHTVGCEAAGRCSGGCCPRWRWSRTCGRRAGWGGGAGSGRPCVRCRRRARGLPACSAVDRRRAAGSASALALLLRYGSYQVGSDPIVAGLALGLAAVLIAATVLSWLLRRRARRTTSRL